MDTCTVHELAEKLNRGDEFLLLDVRTEEELELAALEGALNLVLDELEARIEEIRHWEDKEIVTMCHHGMRSAAAQDILLAQGFAHVRNLTGGIDAYAVHVDASIGRY